MGADHSDGTEFQILTPSFFVGFLNTMFSLVKVGVSTQSFGGQAFDVGVSALRSVNGENRETCPLGSFTWAAPETLNETIRELAVDWRSALTGRAGVAQGGVPACASWRGDTVGATGDHDEP